MITDCNIILLQPEGLPFLPMYILEIRFWLSSRPAWRDYFLLQVEVNSTFVVDKEPPKFVVVSSI